MLKNHRNIRFALRATVLMVLASLALAPGLARNQAGLRELLGHIAPTLQSPAIALAPPVLSSAQEPPLVLPAAQPGDDEASAATAAAIDDDKPARQTSGAIAIQQPEARPAFAARPSGSGFGGRPGMMHSGIGSGAGTGSPEKSVATAQQTFAPAERGDVTNPDDPVDSNETGATAPAETAGDPPLVVADNNFHDPDSDEFHDEDSPPEFNRESRPVVQVPEPSGLALLAVGLFCLALCRHLPR